MDVVLQRLERLHEVMKILNENGQHFSSVNQLLISVGMSRQAASSYATGKRGVGTETINKLAEQYDINPSYVLYGHTPVLRHSQQFVEPEVEYERAEKIYSYDLALYKELKERISDLHRFISRLEKNLDDKEKIIRLLEDNNQS